MTEPDSNDSARSEPAPGVSPPSTPPLPGDVPPARTAPPREDLPEWDPSPGPWPVVDALLKHPALLFGAIDRGEPRRLAPLLVGITVVSVALYGLSMGVFAWGHQLWAVPLKLAAVALFSSFLCLPSLYILSCLSGCNLSLAKVTGLLFCVAALAGILLTGFAPISCVFSVSTGSIGFMGLLHLAAACTGLAFGLRQLFAGFAALDRRPDSVLTGWCVLFCCVIFQLATTLRPLVGPWEGFLDTEKRFFVQHWMQRESWEDLDRARERVEQRREVYPFE